MTQRQHTNNIRETFVRQKVWLAVSVACLAYGVVCLLQYPGLLARAARVPRMTLEEFQRLGLKERAM